MTRKDQNRGLLVFGFLAVALAAGCGVSKNASIGDTGDSEPYSPMTVPDGGGGTSDGAVPDIDGGDAHPAPMSDGGAIQCRGSIDGGGPFGGCVVQFDDQSWKRDFCHYPVTETVCTGYRARRFNLYTHSWTCYYDPMTLTLVAGEFRDDVTDFCDGSSAEETLGTVPEAGTCSSSSQLCGTDGGIDIGD